MTHNKQNTNQTWLPLIFAIVLSAGYGNVAWADNAGVSMETAPQAQGASVDFIVQDLARRFPDYSTERVLLIDAKAEPQTMALVENGQITSEWVISTATKGLGSRKGSEQTPTGVHRIAQKIGEGAALGAIFKARQNSGRVARILTGAGERSGEDNVTTRILWLDGMEPGVNKGGSVDSYERYIYIHGTDEEGRLGAPASHGCIRMRNQDVIDLFERVDENTLVVITPTSGS